MFNNITLSVFPFFSTINAVFSFSFHFLHFSRALRSVSFSRFYSLSLPRVETTQHLTECAVADQDLVFDPNAWRFLRNSRSSRERGKFPAWCVRQNFWLYDSVLRSQPITTHTHTHTHTRARLKISRIVFITIHCNTVLLFAVIYSPVVKRRWRRD